MSYLSDDSMSESSRNNTTKKGKKVVEMVSVEKVFSPESVAEYSNLGYVKGVMYAKLGTAARKHLSAVGWTFFYPKTKGARRELRYQSPTGKVFYNLLSACRSFTGITGDQQYIDQDREIRPPTPAAKSRKPSTRRVSKKRQNSEEDDDLKSESDSGDQYFSVQEPAKSRKPSTRMAAKKSPKSVLKEDSDLELESDYICSVCHDDGNLLLCDKCPSAFHTKCLGLRSIPQGEWFCPSCSCTVCNLVSNKRDLHTCVQCLHRYHSACLGRRVVFQNPQGNGNWFCSSKCEEIHSGLQNLVGKRFPVVGREDNLEWRLYSGSSSDYDCISKLNEALSIIHECFEPVKEAYNGRDTVEDAVFNERSDLHRLNFPGFYTLALERNGEMITVALIRVHGDKVAEMPLVATRFDHQRLGMGRILMNQLEKTLMQLGVQRLILPAAEAVVDTWVNKFGFSRVSESEKLNFVGCTFLNFYGTNLCQKLLNKADRYSISEAVYHQLQELLASGDHALKSFKRRKMANNGSHSVCVLSC